MGWKHPKSTYTPLKSLSNNSSIFFSSPNWELLNKNLNNLQITKYLINIAKKHISIGKKVKIKFVKDRPGHDLRYALNSNKIKSKLDWSSKTKIFDGLNKTFLWYYNNQKYFKNLKEKDITKRLGR